MKQFILFNIKNRILNLGVLIFIVCCTSCTPSDEPIPVLLKATFNVDIQDVFVNQDIQFNNESTGTDSSSTYIWDFGDGNSSTTKNPIHSYAELGNYTVSLTVKNSKQENTVSKEIIVSLSNNIDGRISLKEKLINLNGKIVVCAHRGNHTNAPENSLKSITDAINNGIGMVELDIRQTKDGELVLMHDTTIDRTTNGTGKVSDFMLQELLQYNLYKDNGTLTNEKIPTLKEVLELSRGKIYIDLDIDKKASFNKVFTLINQYGMLKQVLFYSSEFSVIRDIIDLNNNNVIAMPIVRNQSDFDQYLSFNLNVMQFNVDDNSIKQQIQSKGWYIFRNAYVNTNTTPQSDNYTQLNNVINVGGSIVQTDNPIEVKSKLQSQNLND